MFFKFDEYPAVDKKKWKEGATVKSRNEPHTIRQVPNNWARAAQCFESVFVYLNPDQVFFFIIREIFIFF